MEFELRPIRTMKVEFDCMLLITKNVNEMVFASHIRTIHSLNVDQMHLYRYGFQFLIYHGKQFVNVINGSACQKYVNNIEA